MIDQNEVKRLASRLLPSLRAELGLPQEIYDAVKEHAPAMVSDLYGNPSYWLVPLAIENRLAGFIRLSLEGAILSYGRFGQGRKLDDLPPLSYLSKEQADRELKEAFESSHRNISPAVLVHDGPPERIAWMSTGESLEGLWTFLFWAFGFSYSRLAKRKNI